MGILDSFKKKFQKPTEQVLSGIIKNVQNRSNNYVRDAGKFYGNVGREANQHVIQPVARPVINYQRFVNKSNQDFANKYVPKPVNQTINFINKTTALSNRPNLVSEFTVRQPAKAGVRVLNALHPGLVSGDTPDDAFTPKSGVEKLIFGKTPVGTFKKQKQDTAEFGSSLGLDPKTTGAISPFIVAAGLGLDVLPGGGKSKAGKVLGYTDDVVKAIAKSGKVDDIIKLGVKDKDLAQKLTKISDVKQVKSLLNNKVSQNLAAFRKTRPADLGKNDQAFIEKMIRDGKINSWDDFAAKSGVNQVQPTVGAKKTLSLTASKNNPTTQGILKANKAQPIPGKSLGVSPISQIKSVDQSLSNTSYKNIIPDESTIVNPHPSLASKTKSSGSPLSKLQGGKSTTRLNQQYTNAYRPDLSTKSGEGLSLSTQLKGTQLSKTVRLDKKLSKMNQEVSPLGDSIPQEGNTRKFIEQIRNNPTIPDGAKKELTGLYKVRNTKELAIKAKNFVKSSPDVAKDVAINANDDTSVAVAMELIKNYQSKKEFDVAIDLANSVASRLTESGRAVQAASIYGRLTPEGALRFASKEVNKFNRLTGKNIQITTEKANAITERAQKIQGMAEGYKKDVAIKELMKEIYETVPATASEKAGTLQTMAQLLNPKTMIRNVGGNTMFQGVENVSQLVSAPLDKIVSLATKQRTTALPSLIVQGKGMKEGLFTASKEAWQGINLGPKTQFDLPDVPVFRDKILGTLEKTMNVGLRATDRAGYKAAFDDTINGLMKLNKTTTATPEMMEQAHHMGLYRTFQDSNMISNFFVKMKGTLNQVGFGPKGKRFGLGDLILKYPKTPGNLLARGIDYSPAGFIKTVFEGSKPLFGKPFNQKAFVDSFSRAVVGSGGIVGTGIVLGKLGIITEAPSKDKDVVGVQKTQGQGGYQINVSALKRFVMSGLNPEQAKLRNDDTLVSYDWAQPMAIPLSMGAKIANGGNAEETGNEFLSSLEGGVETLANQPLVTGVKRFFGGQDPVQSFLIDPAKQAPASFVPTALNQVRQLTDNATRETHDPNAAKEAINMVKNKIPGVASSLPQRINVLGKPQEMYQGGTNNPFNVFLNPAFVSKYTPNTVASETIGLNQKTGDTSQMPRVVPQKVTINGKELALSPKQIQDYQTSVGQKTDQEVSSIINTPEYQSSDNASKVKTITNMLSDINSQAKEALFGQSTGSGTSTTEDGAKISLVKTKLKSAAKGTKQKVGDSLIISNGDGTVRTKKLSLIKKEAESYKLDTDISNAKTAKDLKTWATLQTQKAQKLQSELKDLDPEADAVEILRKQHQIQTIVDSIAKYQGQGGFTKGKKLTVKKPSKIYNPKPTSKLSLLKSTSKSPKVVGLKGGKSGNKTEIKRTKVKRMYT